MNQFSPVLTTQFFFTAREMAEIAAARGLRNFPNSERGVRLHAEANGWNDLAERLVRWRPAEQKGGRPSREYSFMLMPPDLRTALEVQGMRAAALQRHETELASDRRKMLALQASQLSARNRQVMEARADILASIDGYAISRGQPRSWGIVRFLAAQEAYTQRQDLQKRLDLGHILTDRERTSLGLPLVLTAQDGFQLDPARLMTANDRRKSGTVNRSAIYDWFKRRDERGVLALAPEPTRTQQPVSDSFVEFLRFYAAPSKPSVADAYAQYAEAAAKKGGAQRMTLTQDQVRWTLRTRLNNVEKMVGREGLLTLRSRLSYVTRTTEDMWPTTIYTADGKTFDAEIADPVTKRPIRPEITTVLDVVTRKVVGISLARSENQRSVAEALRNACVANGIPAIFYTDRGPGYRNDAMDADVSGLMGRLGITKMHAAPYGSQAKGRIERPNATIWDVLAKRLPTYIGEDMDKEAGQKIHKITRREIKEFGQSRHLPSWDDFVRLCEARIAEYNDKPHRGLPKFADPVTGKLRHMSPNECWAAHAEAGFEPVSVEPGEADDLFRPYEIRTVARAQVQWNTNFFFHEALEAYHQERVMVGYDYHQADRVWVREFDRESGQPGRLICVARFGGNSERYVPLSYEQKALETRAQGRLRRVRDKADAIEAERDAHLMIERRSDPVADFIDVVPAPAPELQPLTLAADNTADAAKPAAPRRQIFRSDEELAAWALQHPNDLTPKQIEVLRRCMSSSTNREYFRLSGIDTEALRTLLRAVA